MSALETSQLILGMSVIVQSHILQEHLRSNTLLKPHNVQLYSKYFGLRPQICVILTSLKKISLLNRQRTLTYTSIN